MSLLMSLPVFSLNYLLIIPFFYSLSVLSAFLLNYLTKKHFDVNTRNGLLGLEAVEKIAHTLPVNYKINIVPKLARESWDPVTRSYNLTQEIAYGHTISGIALIAHEMGHMQQQQSGNSLYNLRINIVPVINLTSNLCYLLMIPGLILQSESLLWLAMILFLICLIVALISIPIEINANDRALNLLLGSEIVYKNELPGIKQVLGITVFKYIATFCQSPLVLLRFLFRYRRNPTPK